MTNNIGAAVNREPLIWASTGSVFEFRVEVKLRGRPNKKDCVFFDKTMKLASHVLHEATEGSRFTGFDGISEPPQ